MQQVGEKPSGDGGVEHHQGVIADDRQLAVDMPRLFGRSQCIEGKTDVLLAGPSNGEFHDHDRKTEDDEKQDVDEHKSSPAVPAGNKGKSPYISQSDGASS